MPARTLLICAALLTAACSTVQENPNYQFSSKYEANGPVTGQTSGNTSAVGEASTQFAQVGSNISETQTAPTRLPVPTSRALITAAQSDDTYVSPTERAYDTDRMVGTPGYEAMQAQGPAVAPTPAPQRLVPYSASPQIAAPQTVAPQPYVPAPRPITYDYAQNLTGREIDAPSHASAPAPLSTPAPVRIDPLPAAPTRAPAPAAPRSVNATTQQGYVVRSGDTIYSLSRRLCAPISDIVRVNGVGNDFAISIGQTLILPQSRC